MQKKLNLIKIIILEVILIAALFAPYLIAKIDNQLSQNIILIALIVVHPILLFIYTIRLYFSLKERFSKNNKAEIIALSPCFFISICALFFTAKHNIGIDGSFWKAMFETIGQFTFQKWLTLDGSKDLGTIICLLPGIALYSGVTFVTIISSSFSYEFYSKIRLFGLRLKINKKNNYYIFTGLTNNSLTLAKSIKEKDGMAIIVFSGPQLGKFDKSNLLCLDVIANGFYYWSYRESNKKSIVEEIGIKSKNNGKKSISKRVVVFAYCEDEKGNPIEEHNLSFCFNDIDKRIMNNKVHFINNIFNSNGGLIPILGHNRIEYIILTKMNKNYSKYQSIKDEKIKDFIERISKLEKVTKKCSIKDIEDNENDIFSLFSDFIIWNEANITSNEIIEHVLLWRKAQKKKPKEDNLRENNNEESVNLWCIGFGDTNQLVAGKIYISSFDVIRSKEKLDEVDYHPFKTSMFNCYAFDKDMDQISGIFEGNHPLYAVSSPDKDNLATDKEMEYIFDYLIDSLDNKATETKGISKILEEDKISISHLKKYIIQRYNRLKNKRLIEEKNEEVLNGYIENLMEGKEVTNSQKEIIKNEIMIPNFSLSSAICQSADFMYRLDHVTGQWREGHLDTLKKIKNEISSKKNPQLKRLFEILSKIDQTDEAHKLTYDVPDMISIATGNDFQNIETANVIIKDIINEKATSGVNNGYKKDLIIFVKIQNSENNRLLFNGDVYFKNNICEFTNERLKIVIIGNSNVVFSYENTIGFDEALKFNHSYECANKLIEDNCMVDELHSDSAVIIKKSGYSSFPSLLEKYANDNGFESNEIKYNKLFIEKIRERIKEEENRDNTSLLKWHSLKMWQKESNLMVEKYKKLYQEKAVDVLNDKDELIKLCVFEHVRWNRFHIIGGWNYSKQRNDQKYLHSCIVPECFIPIDKIPYDIIIVLFPYLYEKISNTVE